MILPGWNVSEPIDLAVKLYDVVEALRTAPEGAKSFISKVDGFRRSLEELQQTLKNDIAARSSAKDLDHLHATLVECQECVERCEEFGQRFKSLTRDGRGGLLSARQAARWVWQDKKVARLRAEVDSQMGSIGLCLMIKTFADGRSRQGSAAASPAGFDAPRRAGTFASLSSLPPYSPPQPGYGHSRNDQQARTPADYLGPKVQVHHKKNKEEYNEYCEEYMKEDHSNTGVDSDKYRFLLGSENKGKRTFLSPETSPNALRPFKAPDDTSAFEEMDALKPLESRRNTENEVAISPENSLNIWKSNSSTSSTPSRASIGPSSLYTEPSAFSSGTSRKLSVATTSTDDPRRDMFAESCATPEAAMENLKGVKLSYYKAKSRVSYPVTRIKVLRDCHTRRRYIVIQPPTSSNLQFYLFPRSERIIPHSEHPEAYGSSKCHKIKFIEPYLLSSQKLSETRKEPDQPIMASTPLTTMSSAASVRSMATIGSPVLAMNEGTFKEESWRQEYDFESEEDYRSFQELLMGQDVKLQLQVPVQLITAKRYDESKPSKQSELQLLRLWQLGRHQFLTFFCNSTSNKYKEYKIEYFRPVESKSKTVVKLDVYLPGMIRRGSKSKSPLMIAQHPAHEQAPDPGLTAETDQEDLRCLDYLALNFTYSEGKTAFLRDARFHGLQEDPVISPFPTQSRSSTV